MKLVHYSDRPLGKLQRRLPVDSFRQFFKPTGLWVSDDDAEWNWRTWCMSEDFNISSLTHVHDVTLKPDANVLIIGSADGIDRFTRDFGMPGHSFLSMEPRIAIDWPRVAEAWDGIVITPYIGERRLHPDAMWYYVWDCASGCIWHPRAVAEVSLRKDE